MLNKQAADAESKHAEGLLLIKHEEWKAQQPPSLQLYATA